MQIWKLVPVMGVIPFQFTTLSTSRAPGLYVLVMVSPTDVPVSPGLTVTTAPLFVTIQSGPGSVSVTV